MNNLPKQWRTSKPLITSPFLPMFKLASLHPQTQAVFALLATNPLTQGFLLIGGTALALHIGHRQSNDLDFVFCEPSGRLPVSKIDPLVWQLQAQGHRADLVTDAAQASAFRINTGENLFDYARDYAINGVKVTFFAASPQRQPKRFAFWSTAARNTQVGCHFSVLSVEASKIAKTVILQDRVRSRDLFDLMVLMQSHGYNVPTFFDNVRRYAEGATDGETERLILRGLIPLDRQDEGLQAVNVAATLPEMYRFFDARLTEHETQIHKQNLREVSAVNRGLRLQ